jgi:hypothetical protein
MQVGTKLDDRLLRAMRDGPGALPGDLRRLADYMEMIGGLLTEKAAELEPSWALACAAAAEIETLHALEQTVAERAIAVRATSLEEVRGKLAIWRALSPEGEGGERGSPRDRLILSIDADLQRLMRAKPPRPR